MQLMSFIFIIILTPGRLEALKLRYAQMAQVHAEEEEEEDGGGAGVYMYMYILCVCVCVLCVVCVCVCVCAYPSVYFMFGTLYSIYIFIDRYICIYIHTYIHIT